MTGIIRKLNGRCEKRMNETLKAATFSAHLSETQDTEGAQLLYTPTSTLNHPSIFHLDLHHIRKAVPSCPNTDLWRRRMSECVNVVVPFPTEGRAATSPARHHAARNEGEANTPQRVAQIRSMSRRCGKHLCR